MSKGTKHFLSHNLKTIRINKGYSVRSLAEAMQNKKIVINQDNLTKYECSQIEPSLDRVKDIADFFGISVDQLVYKKLQTIII